MGMYEGVFTGGSSTAITQWTPENEGLYLIETFMWDENDVAISNVGPIMLVVVS